LGIQPTKVDVDLWMREKDNHYEYVAISVDDVLVWSKQPMSVMNKIKRTFQLRDVKFPDYYLGADVNVVDEADLKEEGCVLGLSAKTYIDNNLGKLAKLFGTDQFHKAKTPMREDYHPG